MGHRPWAEIRAEALARRQDMDYDEDPFFPDDDDPGVGLSELDDFDEVDFDDEGYEEDFGEDELEFDDGDD